MSEWKEIQDDQAEDARIAGDDEKLSSTGMAAIQGISDSQYPKSETLGLEMDIAQAEDAKAEAIKQAEDAIRGGRVDSAERSLHAAADADQAISNMHMEQLEDQSTLESSEDAEESLNGNADLSPPSEHRAKPAVGEAAMAERAETDAEKVEREMYIHNPEGKRSR